MFNVVNVLQGFVTSKKQFKWTFQRRRCWHSTVPIKGAEVSAKTTVHNASEKFLFVDLALNG